MSDRDLFSVEMEKLLKSNNPWLVEIAKSIDQLVTTTSVNDSCFIPEKKKLIEKSVETNHPFQSTNSDLKDTDEKRTSDDSNKEHPCFVLTITSYIFLDEFITDNFTLSWHPNGEKYLVHDGYGHEIFVVSKKGEMIRQVILDWRGRLSSRSRSEIFWHPNGTRIIGINREKLASSLKIWNENGTFLENETSAKSWDESGFRFDDVFRNKKFIDRLLWNTASKKFLSAENRLVSQDIVIRDENLDLIRTVRDTHTNLVTDFCWHPDGTMFATCSNDCSFKLWSVDGILMKHVPCAPYVHTDILTTIDWLSNGSRLVTYSRDGVLGIWTKFGGLIRKFSINQSARFIALNPKSSIFFIGLDSFFDEYHISIRDENGEQLQLIRIPLQSGESVTDTKWHPSGQHISVCTSKQRVQLWTVHTNT